MIRGMSLDHEADNLGRQGRPLFPDVTPGMTVIARHDFLAGEAQDRDWWIGHVIRRSTIFFRSPTWTPARFAGSMPIW